MRSTGGSLPTVARNPCKQRLICAHAPARRAAFGHQLLRFATQPMGTRPNGGLLRGWAASLFARPTSTCAQAHGSNTELALGGDRGSRGSNLHSFGLHAAHHHPRRGPVGLRCWGLNRREQPVRTRTTFGPGACTVGLRPGSRKGCPKGRLVTRAGPPIKPPKWMRVRAAHSGPATPCATYCLDGLRVFIPSHCIVA